MLILREYDEKLIYVLTWYGNVKLVDPRFL